MEKASFCPKLCAAGIVNLEEWPTFYEDMQEDLEQYCSKFGEVLFVGAEKKLGCFLGLPDENTWLDIG